MPAKGQTFTEEQRARISANRKGKGIGPMSNERKAKIRAARLLNNPMKGGKHTEDTRAKMRAAKNPGWKKAAEAVNWQGGRNIDHHGYVQIYAPDHPNAVGNYVPEHRLVMSRKLGRTLQSDEAVHHINHQRTDNRPENLELLSIGEHSRLHRLEEMAAGKGGARSRRRSVTQGQPRSSLRSSRQ